MKQKAAELRKAVEAVPAKAEPANEMPAAGSQKPASSLNREKGAAAGRYSPAVLRLSQDNGIDLSLVEGSGKEGRITRKDLLTIIESGNIPTAAVALQRTVVETAAPAAGYTGSTCTESSGASQCTGCSRRYRNPCYGRASCNRQQYAAFETRSATCMDDD